MGNDKTMEGAGPRAEPGRYHVTDGIGHAGRVAFPCTLHQLVYEGESQRLLSCRCNEPGQGGRRLFIVIV